MKPDKFLDIRMVDLQLPYLLSKSDDIGSKGVDLIEQFNDFPEDPFLDIQEQVFLVFEAGCRGDLVKVDGLSILKELEDGVRRLCGEERVELVGLAPLVRRLLNEGVGPAVEEGLAGLLGKIAGIALVH